MPRRDEKLSRDLGARLRELRTERGLTQETLAERIGMDVGNYAHMEQGVSNPTLSTLGKVARALDVAVAELLSVPRSRAVKIGRPSKPKAKRATAR